MSRRSKLQCDSRWQIWATLRWKPLQEEVSCPVCNRPRCICSTSNCCHTCCDKLIAFLQNKLGYWVLPDPSSLWRGGNARLLKKPIRNIEFGSKNTAEHTGVCTVTAHMLSYAKLAYIFSGHTYMDIFQLACYSVILYCKFTGSLSVAWSLYIYLFWHVMVHKEYSLSIKCLL